MKVLAEVIGGAQKVLTIGGNPSIPELAALAAGSADRSLTNEEGQELNWILYVPNGKGGFAPASRGDVFDDIEAQPEDGSGSDTFAGPGEAEGEDYAFRIRLFVPSPRPPVSPTDSGPVPIDDDEDVIDLTNIDADSGDLVGLRRVRKKRRRKKTGEATDPGRSRRRRPSGNFPTIKAEGDGTVSEIGPAAATESAELSETGRADLPDSAAEMTFSEGVAFGDDGTSEEAAFELTIGDGTLGPAAQDSTLPEPPSDDFDSANGEDAVTAVALPAVSRPPPPAEPLVSATAEEEVVIGSTTVDHEDVELSIPQDTIPLGVRAPIEPGEDDNDAPTELAQDDNEAPTEPTEDDDEATSEPDDDEATSEPDEDDDEATSEPDEDDDGPPTHPQIANLPPGPIEEADQGLGLTPEPDAEDEDDDAPTTLDGTPDSEEMAAALDAHAPSAPPEPTAPKKKRRRKRKKKRPPARKTPMVAAALLLAAACIGLICLLHSRGVI